MFKIIFTFETKPKLRWKFWKEACGYYPTYGARIKIAWIMIEILFREKPFGSSKVDSDWYEETLKRRITRIKWWDSDTFP